MTDMETFVDWLNNELNTKGWSYSELARRGGITHTSISQIINEKRQPGLKVARGIAKALDTPLVMILRKAGLLSPEPEGTPTSRELLYMFMQLDDEDQERILSITRTFLEEKKGRVIIGGEKPATT